MFAWLYKKLVEWVAKIILLVIAAVMLIAGLWWFFGWLPAVFVAGLLAIVAIMVRTFR